MPDGSVPYLAYVEWSPFIHDCLMLLDADCCFIKWKYNGELADQPWVDIQIYLIIRSEWVKLKNEKMERDMRSNNFKNNKPGSGMRKYARR